MGNDQIALGLERCRFDLSSQDLNLNLNLYTWLTQHVASGFKRLRVSYKATSLALHFAFVVY